MTTRRSRAWARDRLVRAAMRTRRGRRYLTEMRYRAPLRVRSGAVVHLDGATRPLAGAMLPQPRVLHDADHQTRRLDDILGPGWSLLGIDVDEPGWTLASRAGLPVGSQVDVVLDDRAPRARSGRAAIADADGQLDAIFCGMAGHFVLVRPDRLAAAVFTPAEADEVAARLSRYAATSRLTTHVPAHS
jgi:3-(3-hydroxy-phenyl)propionate hydroxylase